MTSVLGIQRRQNCVDQRFVAAQTGGLQQLRTRVGFAQFSQLLLGQGELLLDSIVS